VASSWYPKFKEALLTAATNSNPNTGNVKVVLLSATYTYSAAHQFYSDLSGVVANSGNLATKTFTSGVFDADDVTFSAVTGSAVTQYAIYIDTGTTTTSRLMLFFDTASSGLPVTPNGGSINLQFDSGSNKIAAL
jgi:hypothetical protein